MKKIIAANTLSQLIGRGISVVTTLIVTLVVARQAGASGYGDFVKITTYVAFFYLIVDFGINAIFLQNEDREIWPALVFLRLLGSAALIVLSLGILAFLPGARYQGYTPAVRLGILLFSPTILFQGMITTANAIFQKKLRYDLAAWAIFFGSLFTLLFVRQSAIIALSVGALVTALFSLMFAFRLAGRIRFSPTADQIKRLFVPAIPLGLTLLFNLVYFHADSVVITLTRPTPEVGIYGLAYKVFEVVLVFPTFFMNAVYPLMLKQQYIKKILINSVLFLFGTSVVSVIGVWFAAPLLVFIKNDFSASIGALRVLSLGLPLFFVTSATMWGLIAKKKQTALAVIYGASMAINIVGNSIFVPTHGFIAAAWMTVAGEGVVLLLSGIVLLQTL